VSHRANDDTHGAVVLRDAESYHIAASAEPHLVGVSGFGPGRLEPVAPADGGDLEIEVGVLGVAAVLDEILRRGLLDADLVEGLPVAGVLAEMRA
jgi:hypothetical protein